MYDKRIIIYLTFNKLRRERNMKKRDERFYQLVEIIRDCQRNSLYATANSALIDILKNYDNFILSFYKNGIKIEYDQDEEGGFITFLYKNLYIDIDEEYYEESFKRIYHRENLSVAAIKVVRDDVKKRNILIDKCAKFFEIELNPFPCS